MAVTETIFDGKVNLYQRGKAVIWQCATYLEDKKTTSFDRRKEFFCGKRVCQALGYEPQAAPEQR